MQWIMSIYCAIEIAHGRANLPVMRLANLYRSAEAVTVHLIYHLRHVSAGPVTRRKCNACRRVGGECGNHASPCTSIKYWLMA
jgi:hypothetical protein